MIRHVLLLLAAIHAAQGHGQTFTLNTAPLTNESARSGGCVGIADMDGDGFDDLILLNQSKQLSIDYQNADGSYTSFSYGTVSNANQWGMAVGDVDGDGHKDFVSGGSYDGVHFVEISARGVYSASDLNNGNMFMQCMNMADINNDGKLDVFGCHDDAAPRIWLNNGSGGLSYNNYVNFNTTPASDMSGNYGSTFTDFDNDGDIDFHITKCRQGVNNPSDPRRWNRMFVNNGSNQYTDQAAPWGLQNQEQSWSSDFADIDNDGDLDLITTNHSTTIQLFRNNGSGPFTNITAGSGLQFSNFFLQSKCEDLDNDGFIDLVCTQGNYYFRNNGNGTFTRRTDLLPHPTTNHVPQTFAMGDMDHDGDIDLYVGYGTSYVTPSNSRDDELYLNNGNSNHWINFQLEGTTSNRDGVGARVTLFGPWGRQVREVRAGESYGIVNSFTCHFGLGANTVVDSAQVRWPSGTVDRYYALAADQWVQVVEGQTTRARVGLSVLLGGPYNSGTGLMGDGLRAQGLVPLTEPYSALGFTITGVAPVRQLAPQVLTVTGSNAIVDWVWVELRSTASPNTVVAARPALVQRDGDVVEVDGVRPVWLGAAPGSYHVALRHRNHLGVMTAAGIALSGAPATVDLRANGTAVFGTGARREVDDTAVLWEGNVLRDGRIKYTGTGNDRDPIIVAIGGNTPNGVLAGYRAEDVNMDGTVKYTGSGNDRDPVLVNVGAADPTGVRIEQLP
jgi:hypothetical protein